MIDLATLRGAALEIFEEALASVDAGLALRRALSLEGPTLKLLNRAHTLDVGRAGAYAVAIGKAARPMALALHEILGEHMVAGVITAPNEGMRDEGGGMKKNPDATSFNSSLRPHPSLLPGCWRLFAGGHPLPNPESLEAARAAFELLRRADEAGAPVIFLISGGGSAMMEWPQDERITLDELREANRILVGCGASIAEVNAVRRAFSAVKGGRLARLAPRCDQLSLIVSDTGAGQEEAVASGPTLIAPERGADAVSVIYSYGLEKSLPESVLRAIRSHAAEPPPNASGGPLREQMVLLDNGSAQRSAAEAARARGFVLEVADDVVDQPVAEGCSLLIRRLLDLRRGAVESGRVACIISGGEFACPVRGAGVGGRNSESALRWAIELDELASAGGGGFEHVVMLSAGTDGIDGNSPAAGAVADETTIERARAAGLDARRFLAESDSHTLFSKLGDSLTTGPTGTNVRDLRVMLAS